MFSVLSFAFPVPGEHAAANLGIPDLFFFALFLGCRRPVQPARRLVTWVCSGGVWLAGTIALTVWLDVSGLPALAGLAAASSLPNVDLLVARLRGQPGPGDRPHVAVGGAADDG